MRWDNDKKKSVIKRGVMLIILGVIITACMTGCGKAMTEKQFNQLWVDYQNDKIDDGYYDLAFEAYQNGEPMPSKLWYKIKTFFSNLGLLIVGVAVIMIVIYIIKRSKQ